MAIDPPVPMDECGGFVLVAIVEHHANGEMTTHYEIHDSRGNFVEGPFVGEPPYARLQQIAAERTRPKQTAVRLRM